jgi:hypothetical protein
MAIARPGTIDAAPARQAGASRRTARTRLSCPARNAWHTQGKKVADRRCGRGDRGEAVPRPDQARERPCWFGHHSDGGKTWAFSHHLERHADRAGISLPSSGGSPPSLRPIGPSHLHCGLNAGRRYRCWEQTATRACSDPGRHGARDFALRLVRPLGERYVRRGRSCSAPLLLHHDPVRPSPPRDHPGGAR